MKLQDINKFPLFKTMPALAIFGISNTKKGLPGEVDCKELYDGTPLESFGQGQAASELIKRSVDILAKCHKEYRPDMHTYYRSRATNDMELMIYHNKIDNPSVAKDIMKNYKIEKNTKKIIQDIVSLKY